jgi:hypothetical protein
MAEDAARWEETELQGGRQRQAPENDEQPVLRRSLFVQNFVAGVSHIVIQTCSWPLMRVRLMAQCQLWLDTTSVGTSIVFDTVFDSWCHCVQNEGFCSIWNGNIASMASSAWSRGFNLFFKERISQTL